MSRLESQMSQMFEEMKPHARHWISGCRREIKFKHEAGLKRARLNEHMEPQVPVGKTSAAGQGIRRPGHPSPGVPQERVTNAGSLAMHWLDVRGNFSCNVSFIRDYGVHVESTCLGAMVNLANIIPCILNVLRQGYVLP